MTSFEVVGLYVALNIILHLVLMMRVGAQRGKSKVNLGDGGDAVLLGRIRAQGNYIENMPLALISLIALAMLSVPSNHLHIFGIVFLVARLFHAQGMAAKDSTGKGRVIGAMLNLLVLLVSAIYILYKIFAG